MEIIHKATTESTNDDIADLARQGYPNLTTVVAKYQTKGRGRRGNTWEAPPGNNLLFSILIRSESDPQLWKRIPQIAGVKLISAIENQFYADSGIKMKWPNDLYYYDKKWSGILVESNLGNDPFAILGIGVNCFGTSSDYPTEIQNRVTTLEEIFRTGEFDPGIFLKAFLQSLDSDLEEMIVNFDPVLNVARERDYLFGKSISVLEDSKKVSGTAAGIGNDGELIIVDRDGIQRSIIGGTILEMS